MITSLLRILSINVWATGSTFLIETISLMLEHKKKTSYILYFLSERTTFPLCIQSKSFWNKENKNLVLFSGNKERSSSHNRSLGLSSGSLTSTKTICVIRGFLFHQIPTHKKETKHSKWCNAVNTEVDGKTRIGSPSLQKVLDRTLCWLMCVCCFFGWFPLMRRPVNKAPITT